MMEERLLNLLQRVRDDSDEAARTELNELLRKHPEARTIMSRSLVDEQALVSHLRDESIVSILDAERGVAISQPLARPTRRLLVWPQQIAAALVAGAMVGLLGVGVVWAVKSPQSQARAIRVANGDFETFSGLIETGFPSHTGMWGGNPASTQVNFMKHVQIARKRNNAIFVVIDPYLTKTAKLADIHIKLFPALIIN